MYYGMIPCVGNMSSHENAMSFGGTVEGRTVGD